MVISEAAHAWRLSDRLLFHIWHTLEAPINQSMPNEALLHAFFTSTLLKFRPIYFITINARSIGLLKMFQSFSNSSPLDPRPNRTGEQKAAPVRLPEFPRRCRRPPRCRAAVTPRCGQQRRQRRWLRRRRWWWQPLRCGVGCDDAGVGWRPGTPAHKAGPPC